LKHTHSHQWPILQWRSRTLSPAAVGWWALSINIFAASTYGAFAKTLTNALSPQALLFFSETLTALFILFTYGAIPTLRELWRIPRKQLLPLFVVGIFSGFIAPLLWFTGVHHTSAVNATLFSNAEMIFLIGLAVLLLKERITRIHVLSISIIGLGILVIALQGFTQNIQLQYGDFLIVLASLGFGIGSVTYRKYFHHIDPHIMLFVRSLIGISGFFLLSPFVSQPLIAQVQVFPLHSLPILIGFALISRFLNAFSFYTALDRLPVSTVSLASNLTIICATAFSAWFLKESLYNYHFVGGLLIVLGTVLLEIVGTHQTKKHLKLHLHGRPHRA